MKTMRVNFAIVVTVALSLLLVGCAHHRIDWNARVGSYTFDQAVLEIGPPDKQAELQDGTLVAEWLTRRGRTHGFVSAPFYSWGGYYGPAYGGYSETSTPDYFLRLTFAPDGRLQSWKKFAR